MSKVKTPIGDTGLRSVVNPNTITMFMNLLKRDNRIIDITLKGYTNKNVEYQKLYANAQIKFG